MSVKQVDVSIIIASWNTCNLLNRCLCSIYETIEGLSFEVIVIDNASGDGSATMVRDLFPQVRLIENQTNVGFARANNQGVAKSMGRHLLLLNSDTRILAGAVEEMVRFLDRHPNAGIVGLRLLNPDGSFQFSHVPFPSLSQEFLMLSGLGRYFIRPQYPSYGPAVERGAQKVDYVMGACLLARHRAVEQVGGLDECIFLYSEEIDWCYRFSKANWEVWYLPHATILHDGGQSTRQVSRQRELQLYHSRVYFFRKHYAPGATLCLMLLIWFMTLFKMPFHMFVRFISGGRRGKECVSISKLYRALKDLGITTKGPVPPNALSVKLGRDAR
jgi:N-acetylglucosaminyl-diphospho-decaprenol L-rhamnosyltransferase